MNDTNKCVRINLIGYSHQIPPTRPQPQSGGWWEMLANADKLEASEEFVDFVSKNYLDKIND